MTQPLTQNCILDFLTALKENNSREWMLSHKTLYKEAAAQFEQFLQELIDELAHKDSSIAHLNPKDLTFKLNRDTRFSHDKSPYNPSFRAHIAPSGKLPIPVGYYVHLTPGGSFLGGGLFASQFADATLMVRTHIVKNGPAFEEIVTAPAFAENFTLVGERLKNVPRGFDPEFPQSGYLKHKSWAIEYSIADEELSDLSALCKKAAQAFLLMRPFNQYLNEALREFRMPERPSKG